ncbi:MAG: hypothetical protein ACUVTN_10915 [Thermodesulfobacteriota bacterium]
MFLFYSTRSKLIISFLGVSFLGCGVAPLVGGQLLYQAVLNEAYNRIRLDLNAAREIYFDRVKGIKVSLMISQVGTVFRQVLERGDAPRLVPLLRNIAQQTELDFAGIVTEDRRTLCRIGPDAVPKKISPPNPIANLAFQRRVPIYGTVVFSHEFLFSEDPALAERA